MKITIFGSSGYIGSALVAFLNDSDINPICVDRENWDDIVESGNDLGVVVWCVGKNGNFRSDISGTIQTHISQLTAVLDKINYSHFIYLSSTRVYQHSDHTKPENPLLVDLKNFDDIYNASKIIAEMLVLNKTNGRCSILRLSNVIGYHQKNDNSVLNSLITMAAEGNIRLNCHPDSSKDYIYIKDTIDLIIPFIKKNFLGTFNIGSGANISLAAWIDQLKMYFDFQLTFPADADPVCFPEIDISDTTIHTGITAESPLSYISELFKIKRK